MKHPAWHRLRRERAARYWGKLLPELRVAGNYLPGFFVMGLTVLFLYNRLLDGLTPGPWILPVAAFTLALFLVPVRVRTYAEQADKVFLSATEGEMARVYRRALAAAWPVQLFWVAAAGFAVWPLFRLLGTMEIAAYLGFIIALLVLKTVHMALWWQEQQMAGGRVRRLFAGLRFLAGCAAIAAGLWQGAAWALLIGGVTGLLLVAGYRIPGRHLLNWERLIELERRARKGWRRFLGQMTDADDSREEAWQNPLARLARHMAFGPNQTFRYLYVLIWLRSSLFGMCVRLVAAGSVLAAFAGDVWLRAGIGVLFAAALHLQLKELQHWGRAAEQEYLLPLPEQNRLDAVRQLRLRLWLAGTALLLVPAVIALAV